MSKRFLCNIILKRLFHRGKIFLTKIRLFIFMMIYPPSRKNGFKNFTYVYDDYESHVEIYSGLHQNSLCFRLNYFGTWKDFENFDKLMKYLIEIGLIEIGLIDGHFTNRM